MEACDSHVPREETTKVSLEDVPRVARRLVKAVLPQNDSEDVIVKVCEKSQPFVSRRSSAFAQHKRQ